MKARAQKIPPDLAKPMKIREDESPAVVIEEVGRRLQLLCDWHGVNRGDWFSLALALARISVPGLRIDSSGRPKDWQPLRVAQLKIDLDTIIERRGCSLKAATSILAKSGVWKTSRSRANKPEEVFRKQYAKADPLLVMLLKLRDTQEVDGGPHDCHE